MVEIQTTTDDLIMMIGEQAVKLRVASRILAEQSSKIAALEQAAAEIPSPSSLSPLCKGGQGGFNQQSEEGE